MDENGGRGERLHKVLARAGVASRRDCEKLIADGRVRVDGETVTKMGLIVDPETQAISFDGEAIRVERPAYYLVFKPRGVVCTTRDQFDRKSVVDLVRDYGNRRLFPVGRMEEDSEGLILVTNDGTFANRVLSYKHPLRHLYHVRVRGHLTQEALDTVRKGVWLSDGRSGPMWVKVSRWGKKVSTLMCSPGAQQHRLLRRVWARAGLFVDKVVRVRLGSLTTEGLKKGQSRRLSEREVEALLNPAPEHVGVGRTRPPTRLTPYKQKEQRKAKKYAARRERKREDPGGDPGPGRRVVGP